MGTDTSNSTLNGRIAVVTGGSRGIGFEVARGLSDLGATVVVIGRDRDRVARAAESLVSRGGDAVGIDADVSDPVAMAALPDRLALLTNVDVLVCSAGVMSERMSKTLRTSSQEWRRVMGTNLDGVFNSVATFVPGMITRRWGRVVVVSACLGRFSGPGTNGGLAPYRISKAAVNALAKNLAAETGHGTRGVLVDAMCPAHCRTDMGGPDAPRSAAEGAATALWLAARELTDSDGNPSLTGLLWEDGVAIPW